MSENRETFIDLGLNFDADTGGQPSVQDMLQASFNDEIFSGDNSYFCERCNARVEQAVKRSRLMNVPEYLIVTLNRFYFDRATLTRMKLLTPVSIPIDLSIDSSLFNDPSGRDPLLYDL